MRKKKITTSWPWIIKLCVVSYSHLLLLSPHPLLQPVRLFFKHTKAIPASRPYTRYFLCLEHFLLWSLHSSFFALPLLKYHLRGFPVPSPFKTSSPSSSLVILKKNAHAVLLFFMALLLPENIYLSINCLPSPLKWNLSDDSNFACLVQTNGLCL